MPTMLSGSFPVMTVVQESSHDSSCAPLSPPPPPPSLYIRVESDFGNKNVPLSMLCQIVIGPQFQNLAFSCYFLTCRIYRASENVDCYPKISKNICFVKPGNIFFNFQIKYYTFFNFKMSCDCSLMNV